VEVPALLLLGPISGEQGAQPVDQIIQGLTGRLGQAESRPLTWDPGQG
jgi:hypothetical protein